MAIASVATRAKGDDCPRRWKCRRQSSGLRAKAATSAAKRYEERYPKLGASREHSKIAANLCAFFVVNLWDEHEVEVHPSRGMRVRLPEAESSGKGGFLVPDCLVALSDESFLEEEGLLCPEAAVVAVEVATEESEGHDLGEKMRLWQAMPNLKEYVVVREQRCEVLHYMLVGSEWVEERFEGIHANVPLATFPGSISMPLLVLYNKCAAYQASSGDE